MTPVGSIRFDTEAAAAMIRAAEAYGREHGRDAMEMGLALMVAAVGVLSVRTNNVQIDEIYAYCAGLSASLRKPNAS